MEDFLDDNSTLEKLWKERQVV